MGSGTGGGDAIGTGCIDVLDHNHAAVECVELSARHGGVLASDATQQLLLFVQNNTARAHWALTRGGGEVKGWLRL